MNRYKKENIQLKAEIDALHETIAQLGWLVDDLRRDVRSYSIFFCDLDHILRKIKKKAKSNREEFI